MRSHIFDSTDIEVQLPCVISSRRNADGCLKIASSAASSRWKRCLLAGDAPNVFATFDGSIAQAGGTDRITINLTSSNFNLPNGRAVLGFELEAASGSQLDPQAIQIQDSHGNSVPSVYTNSSLGSNTQSLTVSQLALGSYTLIAAERDLGAFHLAVFLAGDANGSRTVDQADLTMMKNIYGSLSGDGKYVVGPIPTWMARSASSTSPKH